MFSKRSLFKTLKPRLKTKTKTPDKPVSLADWRVYGAAVAPGELHFPLMNTERHEERPSCVSNSSSLWCVPAWGRRHTFTAHLIKFDRMEWRPLWRNDTSIPATLWPNLWGYRQGVCTHQTATTFSLKCSNTKPHAALFLVHIYCPVF